jgi:methylase of polypeptide subunit release factors
MEIRIRTDDDVYKPAADTELLVRSVRLREGDRVLEIFDPVEGKFVVVIFNPAYLPTAPEDLTHSPLDGALDGGPDGTEVTLRFLEGLPGHLREDGRAYLVVSSLQDMDRIEAEVHRRGLAARRMGSESFDFETVTVLELRRPPRRTQRGGAGAV